MATCKECLHFEVCSPYTAPNESYPEAGGCYAFKVCAVFVHVVRCKDCRMYVDNNKAPIKHSRRCLRNVYGRYARPDDFCSYGERRSVDG